MVSVRFHVCIAGPTRRWLALGSARYAVLEFKNVDLHPRSQLLSCTPTQGGIHVEAMCVAQFQLSAHACTCYLAAIWATVWGWCFDFGDTGTNWLYFEQMVVRLTPAKSTREALLSPSALKAQLQPGRFDQTILLP